MKNHVRLLMAAIGSGISTQASRFLIEKGFESFLALVAAVSLGAGTYAILEYIFMELPYKSRFFRSRIDPRARYEGYWMETIDKFNNRYYSLVTIKYNALEDNYTISGEAYDSKGNTHSIWWSITSDINIKTNEISYSYTAKLVNYSGTTSSGKGSMTFHGGIDGRCTRGKGYFEDYFTENRKELIQCDFSFDRLSNEDIKNLIDKENISTSEDIKKLMVRYHEVYGAIRGIS